MQSSYLESVIKQFEYYKLLGEKTFAQLRDEDLAWQPNEESNSIATVVKHLAGNMRSRWTDFLHSDGEKEWRDREAEFDNDDMEAAELHKHWEEGWKLLLDTLRGLGDEDLERIVYIRNEGHTVLEAINRQLAHYPYHVGQIVYIGKMRAAHWNSLSIPRGGSKAFNDGKFAREKKRVHFTDGYLPDESGSKS